MDTDKYQVLLKEIRGTREEIGRIDRDLARDRQDMEDFKVRLGSVEEEIKSFKRMINANADKVADKVSDALEPAVSAVDNLKDEISKKKSIPIQRQPFWKRMFGK